MGDFASLDAAASALGLAERAGNDADCHIWGNVKEVNADGSYQVRLNTSSVSARCANACDAKVGDRVLVTVRRDGRAVAVARLGGILDLVYPVGAVYMSCDPTSPAELFGGTWAPIIGRFLYANASTATGGSNTHELTVGEMPSHAHTYVGATSSTSYGSSHAAVWAEHAYNWGAAFGGSEAGGGQPHNNMPAYQSVYAWRRTS